MAKKNKQILEIVRESLGVARRIEAMCRVLVNEDLPDDSPTDLPRTDDPAPGKRLPLPDMAHIVRKAAEQRPEFLANSCQKEGGTWEFMDLVVDRLRRIDTRWGYNWKRQVVGDPSLDCVDYHYSAGPDEGSTEVYCIDVIVAHCTDNPRPGWLKNPGTNAMWTGRGRF